MSRQQHPVGGLVSDLEQPIVSTAWLAEHLGAENVIILDCSWYLPSSGRNALEEYARAHIPGARFLDADAVSDHRSSLPHMIPPVEQFASIVGALGIGNDSAVIVYDGSGNNLSAGRGWWLFRVFGHRNVAVLDGGFQKWLAESRPVEREVVTKRPAHFGAKLHHENIRDLEAMRRNLDTGAEQVLDARSSGRFEGRDPEPRSGLRGGHIPGSRNLPYTDLVRADGTLLSPDQLRRKFAAAGIDPTRPVVTTCGSGVTACALLLALEAAGIQAKALYDGSWTEWGGRSDTPVEAGP
jgi:thiosulfate/3-mercaptopyruvate sulfurtransferase